MSSPSEKTADLDLFAMSNLRSPRTGVAGAVIWVSTGEFQGKDLQHGPRIKVVPGDKISKNSLPDAVSIRITKPPEVVAKPGMPTLPIDTKKKAIAFVALNYEVLLQYWEGEIDTGDLLESLTPVP